MGEARQWCAVLAWAVCFTPVSHAAEELHFATVKLRYDPEYILHAVARRMNVVLRADVPRPTVLFESGTPLQRFQQAIAAQWGIVPWAVSNAYAAGANEIYLTDRAAYYERRNTTLDDSLAHEFVHYLQLHYFNADPSDESLETDALAIQEWFRAMHPRGGMSIASRASASINAHANSCRKRRHPPC